MGGAQEQLSVSNERVEEGKLERHRTHLFKLFLRRVGLEEGNHIVCEDLGVRV